MTLGTRSNSSLGQDIQLEFHFTEFGILINVDDFQKVEIYSSESDAEAGTNILETIEGTGAIDNFIIGKFKYIASKSFISSPGTFFDKVFIIPKPGESVFTQINKFFVRKSQFGGIAPGDHETVNVNINLFDFVDNPRESCTICIRLNVPFAKYGEDIITEESLADFIFDGKGKITIPLIETDTMTRDTFSDTGDDRIVFYEMTIGKHIHKQFRVPSGLIEASLDELPEVPIEESK